MLGNFSKAWGRTGIRTTIIVGMVVWMLEMLVEYLYELPVFATLAAATVLIPLLAVMDYHWSLARQFLEGVGQDRHPVPPEVFRWKLVRPRWRKSILRSAALLPVGWLPIFWFPAQASLGPGSLVGWVCGMMAILSTALLLSRLWLYFRVAQWFDVMTPRVMGWFWNLMWRISDNTDFLPEKKVPEEEKAVF